MTIKMFTEYRRMDEHIDNFNKIIEKYINVGKRSHRAKDYNE